MPRNGVHIRRLKNYDEEIMTNKIGRPSKYDPEFCERVIALGREGKSKAQMAADLDISRDTLDQWIKIHPEFSDAIARARDAAMAWWEEQGAKGMWAGKGFNAQAWSRSMAARFPDDYREKTDLNVNANVNVATAIVAARKRAGNG
jgi:hypothetical protein